MRYRLACISDAHGTMPDAVPPEGTNAWLVAGDAAHNGDGKRFTLWAMRQQIAVIGVRGEHESGVFAKLYGQYCVDVSGSAHRLGELLVCGIGFSGNMNADTYHLPTEDALGQVAFTALQAIRRRRRTGDAVILLTHYPPSVPKWIEMSGQDAHRFYLQVTWAIEALRPVAVITGHAHGLFGKSMRMRHRSGNTLLVCPGPQPMTLLVDTTRQTARIL